MVCCEAVRSTVGYPVATAWLLVLFTCMVCASTIISLHFVNSCYCHFQLFLRW